jgi:hypothetical protein
LIPIVLVALALSVAGILDAVNLDGYFFRDTLTSVSSATGWENREYKDCFSTNVNTGQQFLACDNPLGGGSAKTFMVRFWGKTHRSDKPEATDFEWKCRKNSEGDPAITCRQKKAAEKRPAGSSGG